MLLKTMRPGLAIIIPAGPGDRAWEGLLPQLADARALEVVLVLAQFENDTVERLPANVTLVRSAPGRAHQLNAGARRTDADWLWFLHADSRIGASTLGALHRFVEADATAIGYFDLRFLRDGPRLMFLNTLGAHARSRLLGLPFGDQGLLMPRRVYDAIGGFDEHIGAGEDHAAIWTARALDIPLRALRAPVYTSARKYAQRGWWATTREHVRATVEQARRFSRQEQLPATSKNSKSGSSPPRRRGSGEFRSSTAKALDYSLRSPSGSSLRDDLRASRLSRLRGNDEQKIGFPGISVMGCGVAIFVKTPSLSPVKTRLWPGIGRRNAETLCLSSAQAVASVAMQARDRGGIEPYWAVAEDVALPTDAWRDLPQLPQGNGSLGERMAQVYRQLRRQHHAAVLIGADAPQLTSSTLHRAADWLSGAEPRLAIGRAGDGGFWLFGGNAPLDDDAWTRVRYSAPDTAVQFMQSMHGSGAWLELETLRDLDTADDIPHVRAGLAALAAPTPAQVRLMGDLEALAGIAEASA
jgi:glycosyltransferase A (GT-A) superfamily protein (DUF2064 family)